MYFDIVVDKENYNHWLPLTLMIIEYGINNIPFSWRHIAVIAIFNQVYVVVNMSYCLHYQVIIYSGVDWMNNPKNALFKGEAECFVLFVFFLVMK